MQNKQEHQKLVRDAIPGVLTQKEIAFSIHFADDDEYLQALRAKLLEEVEELLENPIVEEFADVQEVLLALMQAYGHSVESVEAARVQKVAERGSFKKRVILESTTE